MADLRPKNISPSELRHRTARLTSTATDLISEFTLQAETVAGRDEASRLKRLHSTIIDKFHELKCIENGARYHEVIAGVIPTLTSLFLPKLFSDTTETQPPFGTVLICIDSRGIPDGVDVLSISQMARETKREERNIIFELRSKGNRLLNEQDFTALIESLIQRHLTTDPDYPR